MICLFKVDLTIIDIFFLSSSIIERQICYWKRDFVLWSKFLVIIFFENLEYLLALP